MACNFEIDFVNSDAVVKSFLINNGTDLKELKDYLFVLTDLTDFLFQIDEIGLYDSGYEGEEDDWMNANLIPGLHLFYVDDYEHFLNSVKKVFDIKNINKCKIGDLSSLENIFYHLTQLTKFIEINNRLDDIEEFNVQGQERKDEIDRVILQIEEFIGFLENYYKFENDNDHLSFIECLKSGVELFRNKLINQKADSESSYDINLYTNLCEWKDEYTRLGYTFMEEEILDKIYNKLIEYALAILGRTDITISKYSNDSYVQEALVYQIHENGNKELIKKFFNHVDISKNLKPFLESILK